MQQIGNFSTEEYETARRRAQLQTQGIVYIIHESNTRAVTVFSVVPLGYLHARAHEIAQGSIKDVCIVLHCLLINQNMCTAQEDQQRLKACYVHQIQTLKQPRWNWQRDPSWTCKRNGHCLQRFLSDMHSRTIKQ